MIINSNTQQIKYLTDDFNNKYTLQLDINKSYQSQLQELTDKNSKKEKRAYPLESIAKSTTLSLPYSYKYSKTSLEDIISTFISECLVKTTDRKNKIKGKLLYDTFVGWAHKNNIELDSKMQTKLGEALKLKFDSKPYRLYEKILEKIIISKNDKK